LALSFFGLAAISQGVKKRALDGDTPDPERVLKTGVRADPGADGRGCDKGQTIAHSGSTILMP
jgi:hypothetical protein